MSVPEPTESINKQEPREEKNAVFFIDYYNIQKASVILRALNHKLRQQIIKLVAENKIMTVTELYIKLKLEQSVTSQHLSVLRKTGILTTRREGKFIFYSVNYKRIKAIHEFIKNLVG